MQAYTLTTYQKTTLNYINGGRLIHSDPNKLGKYSHLVLLTSENSNIGLLAAIDENKCFRWEAGSWLMQSILVIIKKVGSKVAILNPATKTLLTSSNAVDKQGHGITQQTRTKIKEHELFSLQISCVDIGGNLTDALTWFHENDISKIDHRQLLQCIRNRTYAKQAKVEILKNVILQLNNEELVKLTGKLKKNRGDLLSLMKIFPNDYWLIEAIPKLVNYHNKKSIFNRKMQANRKMQINQNLDFLARIRGCSHSISIGHLLNSFLRQQHSPKNKSCVVATARNEGIYLLEWVAYYKALGFDEIFIYSNDNSDNSDELLAALAEAGQIVWINNKSEPSIDVQQKAYSHAFSVMPEILDYEWSLVIDMDEFLSFNHHLFTSFTDFLNWHEAKRSDVIAFNWIYIGSGAQVSWQNKPITKRLTYQVGPVNQHIKSMGRTSKVISSHCHFPECNERNHLIMVNANGQEHTYGDSKTSKYSAKALSNSPNDEYAYIYHYFYRTAEEFLWKWSRNRGNRPKSAEDIFVSLEERFLKMFLAQYNNVEINVAENLSIMVPDLDEHIDRISALPKVKESQQLVIESFRIRSAKVLAIYKKELATNYGESGNKMLQILEQ